MEQNHLTAAVVCSRHGHHEPLADDLAHRVVVLKVVARLPGLPGAVLLLLLLSDVRSCQGQDGQAHGAADGEQVAGAHLASLSDKMWKMKGWQKVTFHRFFFKDWDTIDWEHTLSDLLLNPQNVVSMV